jgi:acetoacetate decarboxylase
MAELPVLEVVSSLHMICDLTLGLGKVAYDYLQSPASKRGPKVERVIAGVK